MLIKPLYTLLAPYIIYLASLCYSAVMDKLKSENAKIDVIPLTWAWPPFCNCDCPCVTEQCDWIDSSCPSVRVPAWPACGKWLGKQGWGRQGCKSLCVCTACETKQGQEEELDKTTVKICGRGETWGRGIWFVLLVLILYWCWLCVINKLIYHFDTDLL